MSEILVIDDEKSIRKTLKEILENENYKVTACEDGDSALNKLTQKEFNVILCDIKMPKMDGIEIMEKAKLKGVNTPFIIITGHGTIETAVEALKKGAFDFIQKPLDLNRILVTIRNALDKSSLVEETRSLKKKVKKSASTNIIGESKEISKVRKMIDKVADTDAKVLITGENGVGKELVAKQLHEKSNRNKNPFIEVNCAAIPSELIESELFGHEKGAFTSAIKQRKGSFEQANKGTLFLDEIGDMSLSTQSKVLRALQENKFTRVGGDKDIEVDVRVIAASNKDLKNEINNGNFREDLYHRLSVIVLNVPPLRERKEDINVLTNHFIKEICKEHGVVKKELSEGAIEALKSLEWTGNIRELRNVVERMVILSDDKITENEVKKYA